MGPGFLFRRHSQDQVWKRGCVVSRPLFFSEGSLSAADSGTGVQWLCNYALDLISVAARIVQLKASGGLARSVKVIGLEVVKMEMIVDGGPHITIEEAARELATTPLRILMLIREGVMKGCQLQDEWYVDKNSMACFRAYGADRDKPGGCKGSCASGGCSGMG
jgi:hypothetical protein